MSIDIDRREIERLEMKLKNISKSLDKDRKKVLRRGGRIVRDAARKNVSDAAKPVNRYNTPKVFDRSRAPKGMGKIVATYYPGNLRRSINTLPFRRSKDVFVGPKRSRNPGGDFRGRRVDGWYAHLVEFGTRYQRGIHFMRNAAESSKAAVAAELKDGFKKLVIKAAR